MARFLLLFILAGLGANVSANPCAMGGRPYDKPKGEAAKDKRGPTRGKQDARDAEAPGERDDHEEIGHDAKSGPSGKPEKSEKTEPEKAEKAEKTEKVEEPEKIQKPEKPEKPEKIERPERPDDD